MIKKFITKIFGTKQQRDIKHYAPMVRRINDTVEEWFGEIPLNTENAFPGDRSNNMYYALAPVTRQPTEEEKRQLDEILKGKTQEFRNRLEQGEALDDLLPEAFATVKLACWRMIGERWMVAGDEIEWDMVPYDVQIVGAITLHEGRIAEMATGEGKTLVALMPVYLNALEGRGVHLITVNDYLAKRDSEWMGHILEYLGLTVGCLDKTRPSTPERRQMYECDVTYGTNNEFGFDYLRDNMAINEQALSQNVPADFVRDYMNSVLAFVHEFEGDYLGVLGDFAAMRLPLVAVEEFSRRFKPVFGVTGIELEAHPATVEKLKGDLSEDAKAFYREIKSNEHLDEAEVQIDIYLLIHAHRYAIIDEVDNILIDEARTPLIISGPVDRSTHRFDIMKPMVEGLVKKQMFLVNRLVQEGREMFNESEQNYEAAARLFQAQLAMPKHKMLGKVKQSTAIQRQIEKVELDYIAWKKNARLAERDMSSIEEDLYFTIDEKGHNIDLTERGREELSPDKPERFMLIDVVDEISKLDSDPSLTDEEKEQKKNEIHQENEIRQEELHNISQLLRAYTLYERDVEYVVKDNRVLIVDEFTGRLMEGRRYSDGLHQAIEAKEGVKIEVETQTLATVTLQNYFRMYDKLSGMTGTAATEAVEFSKIYKMDVVEIPPNKPTGRLDENDLIYRTRKEKYNAVIDEIVRLHNMKLPILVGTVSVEVSETLSRMLRRRKISHNVLNAKNHQREAEIIRDAGKPGQVTISTNMAGRGTDIKLQPGELMEGKKNVRDIVCEDEDGYELHYGLQVVGTERHEARRIDLQLRGRSGRQGDPGRSCFFLSLEDNLMRLFGSDRMAGMLERIGMGMEEGEPLIHPWLTKAVQNAQKKVEQRNFSYREQTLKYDDIMNNQRKAIYGLRREILTASDTRSIVVDICLNALEMMLPEFGIKPDSMEEFNSVEFFDYLQRHVPYVGFNDIDMESIHTPNELLDAIEQKLRKAYEIKRDLIGDRLMFRLSKFVLLKAIDDNWKDHLLAIDSMREGIWMRGYAQQDPLVAYQKEAGDLFLELEYNFNKQALDHVFTTQVAIRDERAQQQEVMYQKRALEGMAPPPEAAAGGEQAEAAGGEPRPAKPQPYRRSGKKVGRNDPCPCGSGKKYKKCCGRPGAEVTADASRSDEGK